MGRKTHTHTQTHKPQTPNTPLKKTNKQKTKDNSNKKQQKTKENSNKEQQKATKNKKQQQQKTKDNSNNKQKTHEKIVKQQQQNTDKITKNNHPKTNKQKTTTKSPAIDSRAPNHSSGHVSPISRQNMKTTDPIIIIHQNPNNHHHPYPRHIREHKTLLHPQ